MLEWSPGPLQAFAAAFPRLGAYRLTLFERIADRSATIGIVGLGHSGLPLAVEFGQSFERVYGFDVNPDRVRCVNQGRSHVRTVRDAAVADLVGRERFTATDDFGRLSACDAIVICIPMPLETSKSPDLSYIQAPAARIEAALRPGQLVILESAAYPGTTDEVLLPLLESRGFRLDEDFLLAFSPERGDPESGANARAIPKVVGGCSERSTRAACDLYGAIGPVHPVSSARVAETVKLLETTFRLANIGLINEFAVLCNHLGIDTDEVMQASAAKPFGLVDPLYLTWKSGQRGFIGRFIELADEVNAKMPAYVVDLVADALNRRAMTVRDAHIFVVGAAIGVIDRLRAKGAFVAYHDPLVPVLDFDFQNWPDWRPRGALESERRTLRVVDDNVFSRRRRHDMLESVALTPQVLRDADCVVILTKDASIDYELIAANAAIAVDTHGAISVAARRQAKGRIVCL